MILSQADAGRDAFDRLRLGRDADHPIRICAMPTAGSYGDFATSLLFINTVADHFDHRRLTVIYKNDMDYKEGLLRLLPADRVLAVPQGKILPSLELLNASHPAPPRDALMQQWLADGDHQQDLFITGDMASPAMLWTFERLAYLRFPEEAAAACADELIKAGVKPDRWFCTLHCREPGYESKPEGRNLRDDNPETFFAATAHIIRDLGGQVVRLGHPAMTLFPPMEGLIDLSREKGNSFLQTFAISRARFHLGSASGPIGVASALGVLYGMANAVDYLLQSDDFVFRTVDVITPEGTRLSQESLFDAGYYKAKITRSGKRIEVQKNSSLELARFADHLHDLSHNISGWRTPDPPWPGPRPNRIVWPGLPKKRGTFLPMPP